jgi:glycosyltransferase involved in cell wall biosynthesis
MSARGLAVFLPSLEGGGAQRVMVTLANGFAARGHRVDLVLGQRHGAYLGDVSPKVRVHDLGARRVLGAIVPLAAHLRRHRPLALLSAMSHANAAAIIAARLARVATRIVVSERVAISIEAARAEGLTARSLYTALPRLYRLADVIIAVSKDAASDLERWGRLPGGSIRAIYNPAALGAIAAKAAEPAQHPWFAEPGPPVVLGLGRLVEQKDFATLITAFAALPKRCAARLMILGEGPLRPALAGLARSFGLGEDRFQMPGFVANPFACLARAAMFVLSSRWEGLPNALIEAMACGTPVISTDCRSGPSEILEEGRWGRLVPVGDAEALAQAIADILQTPRTELPDVRRRARDFDQDLAIDAYLEALGAPSLVTRESS